MVAETGRGKQAKFETIRNGAAEKRRKDDQ